jgi:hypothetical protein
MISHNPDTFLVVLGVFLIAAVLVSLVMGYKSVRDVQQYAADMKNRGVPARKDRFIPPE